MIPEIISKRKDRQTDRPSDRQSSKGLSCELILTCLIEPNLRSIKNKIIKNRKLRTK